MLTKLLLWLAGADGDLLAKCAQLPRSERQRLVALGGTVCIPAALALGSWGYAAFTFIHDPRIAVVFGTFGAGVVLWIDRLLLLSFHKSALESAVHFWTAVIVRLLLSGVLSYGLAEPVTLLMFGGPIEQQMADDVRAREEAAFDEASALRAQAYAGLNKSRADATNDVSPQLEHKTIQFECMSSLVTLEMAGGVAAATPVKGRDGSVCGYVSGREGCRQQCQNDIALRDQLAVDMRSIRTIIQSRLDGIDTANVNAAIAEGQRVERQALAEKSPTDYATRRRALGEIEAGNPVIKGVHRFLIFALVLLDSIALIIKAMIPSGEYEEHRDTALAVARAAARAERSAAVEWIVTHGQALQQEHFAHEANKRQIIAVSRAVRQLVEELTREYRLFQTQLQTLERMVVQLKSEEDRNVCIKLLASLQHTFDEALEEALKRFRAEI